MSGHLFLEQVEILARSEAPAVGILYAIEEGILCRSADLKTGPERRPLSEKCESVTYYRIHLPIAYDMYRFELCAVHLAELLLRGAEGVLGRWHEHRATQS